MKFTQVTKRYGERDALRALDLEIAEGEITAVLGESGAGKSTLLGAAAGLIPFEGKIEGGGRVSCLFQSPKLLPNLTVEGNLKFVLPKGEWGGIGGMLARVGLGGREKSYPFALSGGERQRVAIARAFLFPHDTLLMDEPFSALDLSLKKSLCELVTQLWEERKNTVLFVTHDLHEATLLARRALVLRAGRVVLDLPLPAPYPRDFFVHAPEEAALARALMREDGAEERDAATEE